MALAVLPQPALEPTSLPTPFGSVSLFRARMPADHSMTSSDVHHRARRSIASGMAGSVLSRSKRSGHRDGGGGGGVVGPVHTYIRTDYDGNYRWGARHYVGSSYGRGL